MKLSDVVDYFWRVIANDLTFLSYLSLNIDDDIETKRKKIQREMEIDDAILKENIPMCTIYLPQGMNDKQNYLIYNSDVIIDFFASDSDLARTMAQRSYNLFHNTRPSLSSTQGFDLNFVYEGSFATRVRGVKGYRQKFELPVLKENI